MHLLDGRRRSSTLDTDRNCSPGAQVRSEKDVAVRSLVPRSVCGSTAGPTVDSFPLRQEQNPVDPRIHFAILPDMARSSAPTGKPARRGSARRFPTSDPNPQHPRRRNPGKATGTSTDSMAIARHERTSQEPGHRGPSHRSVPNVTKNTGPDLGKVSFSTTRGSLQDAGSSRHSERPLNLSG